MRLAFSPAFLAILLLLPRLARAEVHVVACEPEWAALATELGGGDVTVFAAYAGEQEPHRIKVGPHLVTAVQQADLLLCTGAGLEAGWLPQLLQEAHNPRIQAGQPGHFLAARHVAVLERPTRGDRPQGEAHPEGNPHIQTDPRNIARVADALVNRLIALDPGQADDYRFRHAAFVARWQGAMDRWEARAAALRGTPVVTHDNSWVYLEQWLGLVPVATLEPSPGVPPTAARLAKLLGDLQARKTQRARMVVRTPFNDPQPSEWLASRAGIPAVVLPFTIGGTPAARDLFTLFDDTLDRLRAAVGTSAFTWPP